jgi:hypothetical protein
VEEEKATKWKMDKEETEWTEKPELMMEKKEQEWTMEKKEEKEEEWTMDKLLGFGRFHYFQIWVVQALVAVLGMREALYSYIVYRKVQHSICCSNSI